MSRLWLLVLVAMVSACGGTGISEATKCTDDGTYGLVQTVFEARGCTASVCHGETTEGGLDLRTESAYANLINVPGESADLVR
ncbi:MAG: hypothetical protein WBG86_14055, partial [Polyangiales bacterium]